MNSATRQSKRVFLVRYPCFQHRLPLHFYNGADKPSTYLEYRLADVMHHQTSWKYSFYKLRLCHNYFQLINFKNMLLIFVLYIICIILIFFLLTAQGGVGEAWSHRCIVKAQAFTPEFIKKLITYSKNALHKNK